MHSPEDVALDTSRFESRARLRSFLAIPPDETGVRWENSLRQGSDSTHSLSQFAGRLVCAFARDLLTRLAAAPGPLALPELLAALKIDSKQRSLVAKALRGLCQYVFVVADYDPARADLRLGLWPGLRERLVGASTPAPPPPPAAEPLETFLEPFVCSDMAQVVATAAATPIPVKKQSRVALFAANARKIAGQFTTVPKWVGDGLFEGEQRANVATIAAWDFGWLELDHRKFHFTASRAGRDWLARSPTERLRHVLDLLRQRRWGSPKWSCNGWNFSELAGTVRLTPSDSDILACEQEICAAWLEAPTGLWVATDRWLDHAARTRNPIAAAAGPDAMLVVARRDEWRGFVWVKKEAELLEPEARKMLEDFLFKRLIPLGGVELGRHGAKSTVFRLTEFGRYYLGARKEFPSLNEAATGRVIVQPNFEIMFLGRNLVAEAGLAGFCERIGRDTGAVFRLTRSAVQQALHNGHSVTSILAALREVSDRDIPANVATELAGWGDSRRTFHTSHATLIRCPDATVALRIHSLLPTTTLRLSDTILELTAPLTTPQRRKLETAGLFREAADDHDPEPPPTRRKRRRRRW
jgi:hypothetical protein